MGHDKKQPSKVTPQIRSNKARATASLQRQAQEHPELLVVVAETDEIPGRVPGNLPGYVLQARWPSTKTGARVFIHRARKTCGRIKHGHMLKSLQGRPCKDSEKHET